MEVAEALYTLLSHNVGGDRQLKPRWIGFRAELELGPLLNRRERVAKMLKGGVFLPVIKGASPLDNPVYYTVIGASEDKADYLELYAEMSKIGLKSAYMIVYDNAHPFTDWEMFDIMKCGVSLPVPEFSIFRFDGGRFNLCSEGLKALSDEFRPAHRSGVKTRIAFSEFDWSVIFDHVEACDLEGLYAERLIFDGLLGFGVDKGIPADIDNVIVDVDGGISLVEVKEKDRSKRPPIGFGMDIRRRDDLALLQQKTGLGVFYIVREVKDQSAREFVGWHIIPLNKYITATDGSRAIEGGTGMRSRYSSNPTSVCPSEYFQAL